MNEKISKQDRTVFEEIKRSNENGEFWSARELAKVFEYVEYRNFKPVIGKAKEACANSGQSVENHFVDFHEMVAIGSGAERGFDDGVMLSRYACYLIVQNADPAKAVVATGQTYFAIQTRLQEISQMDEYSRLSSEDERRLFLRDELARHNTQLASAAKDAGVVQPIDYAIFQNHGYKGLYGGLDAKGIHQKKGLTKSDHILDHMGSTELAANLFRATQTEDKLRRENITGKQQANQTHFEIGRKVRETIKEIGGTMPENLPVAESVKKIKKKQESKLLKGEDE